MSISTRPPKTRLESSRTTRATTYRAGFLFPDKKFELAARLENIERDQAFSVTSLGSAIKDFEATGFGVNYYFGKHVNKLQADYFAYEDKVSGVELDEFRVQLQVIF